MGAGRTELFECLMGLHPEASGSIRLNAILLGGAAIAERIEQGITLVPEDRQRLGLVQQLTVGQNLTLASLRRYLSWFWLSDRRENESVSMIIRELEIKARNASQPITSLSGGNQQKAVLARWLASQPRLLILDEPTRGIDIGAKAEIEKLIAKLCAEGMAIVFISSELDEVVRDSHRVVVLRDRKKVGELTGDEIDLAAIMKTIAGAASECRMSNVECRRSKVE